MANPEFGTNTGNQGTFDPSNPLHKQQALQRLQQLYDSYGDKLNYNYTGDTGLAPDDGEGFARFANAQREADNISRIMSGQQPRTIRLAGGPGQSSHGIPTVSPEERSAVLGEAREQDALSGKPNGMQNFNKALRSLQGYRLG